MTTIVLADDHPMVLVGLRLTLEEIPGLRVVGEAARGDDAVTMVDQLRPDILVVDMMMPGLDGVSAIKQVRKRSPHTRIVAFSALSELEYVREATRAGAAAYVIKGSDPKELLAALRAVVSGQRYFSPALGVDWNSFAQVATFENASNPYATLSAREREVFQLAAQGLSTNEIATQLVISPRTAETHRSRCMRKLGLHTQSELVRYAIRLGVIPPR